MKKILIVEDDSFLQGLASQKISSAGFETRFAVSGEAAITLLASESFDCILLDLMLPDMSGFDILKKIRERDVNNTVPVLVFSNLADDASYTKASELGMTEYLIKSNYTLEEIVEKIQKYTTTK
jgi:CheY-like chemotaxis protein